MAFLTELTGCQNVEAYTICCDNIRLIGTNVTQRFIDFKKVSSHRHGKRESHEKNVGLWIDHREAVIVALTDKGEQITRIKSDAETQIRFAGGSRKDGLQTTEAVRGKKLDTHLGKYFDDIIAHIRDAELIQIFGPGDAKNELGKRLEKDGLKERIIEIETVDNMTDNQIAAKARARFTTKDVV